MKPGPAAAGEQPAATSAAAREGRIDTQLRSTSDGDIPETWVEVNALESLEQAARFVMMLLVATSGTELRMLSLGEGRYRFRVTLPQPRVIELVLQSPEFFPSAMRRVPNGELEINLSPPGEEAEPAPNEARAQATDEADRISRLSSLFPGLTRLDDDLGDLLSLLSSDAERPAPDRIESPEPVLQGRIQIVAQPFSSFATLNRFIALVGALPDVKSANLRRFRNGELRLAVDYDGKTPLSSQLQSIREIPFVVLHDGGDLVELTIGEVPSSSTAAPSSESHDRAAGPDGL